jgi:pyruvate,water dikinase
MAIPKYVRWFKDVRVGDVALVGGKNSSLGELYAAFPPGDVKVPNGFAVTAEAYRDALTRAGAWGTLHKLLDGLDKTDLKSLAERAAKARDLVYSATNGEDLRAEIVAAYQGLEAEYGKGVSVAVRSSATAEDLPNASFAGQHDSYLPPLLRVAVHRPRHQLPDRQSVRSLQGVSFGRGDEDGALRPGGERRDFHSRYRVWLS